MQASLPSIRFHDLCHTCATLLARKNVNLEFFQDTLGGASLSMRARCLQPCASSYEG